MSTHVCMTSLALEPLSFSPSLSLYLSFYLSLAIGTSLSLSLFLSAGQWNKADLHSAYELPGEQPQSSNCYIGVL